jgi:diguanylate cyclase (GGDEF)-like protein
MLTRASARRTPRRRARLVRSATAKATAYAPKIWLLNGAIAALAIVVWGVIIRQVGPLSPEQTHGQVVAWYVVAMGVGGAAFLDVTLTFRGRTATLNFAETPLMVGAVFLSPSHLLLAVSIGWGVAHLVKRRPPEYIAFNVVDFGAGAAAAFVSYRSVLGDHSPVSLHGWLACGAGVAAHVVVTAIAVLALLGVTAGRRVVRSTVATMASHTVGTLPLSILLSLCAVTLIWANRLAGILLVALAFLAVVAQRAVTALRDQYANLDRLYRFTVSISGRTEVDDIVPVLLREALDVLAAEHIELLLPGGEACLRYILEDQGSIVREISEDLSQFEELVSGGQNAILVSLGDRRPEVLDALADRNAREAMGAPISVGGSERGVLIVANRSNGGSFSRSDLGLFEALAAQSGVALRGSQLLDQLRTEVGAREHQALHDSLTGLGNRVLFQRGMAAALEERNPDRLVAVMLMDLDGFKEINDTLGHHTGDAILKEAANRLVAAVGKDGLAIRLGGDEFAVVVLDTASRAAVAGLAHRILDAVAQPLSVEGLVLALRSSIGVAIAPDHGLDTSTLLKRADVAMYSAKSTGRGVEVYDPANDHHSTRRLILATELRQALDAGDLEVWYQPKADLRTAAVSGFEALVRWRHALYGQIPPDEFIPVAEQVGLIRPLTWAVLGAALDQLHSWHAHGFDVGVSVNISARNLLDAGIIGRLEELVGRSGVAPRFLTLELTESTVMADADRSEQVLAGLANLGLRIAIDDFGTGYSSLSRLRQLPVHEIKIDKSFVTHLTTVEGNEAIVATTIELASNMGHTVTAEGVEDQATWDRLGQLGCNEAQGYFLARPMPAVACEPWMSQRLGPPKLTLLPRRESAAGA